MSDFLLPWMASNPTQAPTALQQLLRANSISRAACSTPDCMVDVQVGIFFDGTNNNKKRDQEDVPDPAARSHTNVVVLHDCFADTRKYHYRVYIPGVGTAFPKIGEMHESSEGKAMARGGEARIFWAMIQVMNALHRAVFGPQLMFLDDEAAKGVITGGELKPLAPESRKGKAVLRPEHNTGGAGGNHVASSSSMPNQVVSPGSVGLSRPLNLPEHANLNAGRSVPFVDIPLPVPDSTRRTEFRRMGRQLSEKLKQGEKTVKGVTLSIFGFSRGAAEARTFCNWMAELCEGGKFFGIPIRFQFVGLFDTVASVGLANSSPVPNDGGFMGWADGTMELPPVVERCVHYVAAHEIRKSFPLSTAHKSHCRVEEFIYPGAHSDVGGGYAPGDQGKGKSRGDLLSQVPLIHMYQAARTVGVPLMSGKELIASNRADVAKDLDISPRLIDRFNDYLHAGPGGGEVRQSLREHMRWYWRWRLAVGERFESLASYRSATAQDKEDLAASEMDFRRDLAQAERDEASLKYRREHPLVTAMADGAVASQGLPPNIPQLSEAERLALSEKRAKASLSPLVSELFDQHVHDSHASFYLVGPTTAYDRQQMIEAVARKKREGESLNGFERRVDNLQQHQPGAYPKMTDADYQELLEMDGFKNKVTVKWLGMSKTRRESEGHVRDRVIFDKS